MGTRAEARRYPTKRATTNKRIFGRKNTEREGFGFRSFCWHTRPAARARGFCLSAGERPPQTKTSLPLSNPCDTKQLVSHLSFPWKLKTPLMRGLKFPRRGRDSNSRYGFPYAVFPGLCLKPLGHLSKKGSSSGKQINYTKLKSI